MYKMNRDDTIFNLTRITVRPEHRKELCQTISSLIDPVKSEKGCLTYRFYEEAGDENTFVLIGEWETPDAWNSHLKSDNFAVLLGSINLLCNRPNIDFKLLSHVADIEAMTRARIECHSCMEHSRVSC
jgi:quinol monooxygenase YgiN